MGIIFKFRLSVNMLHSHNGTIFNGSVYDKNMKSLIWKKHSFFILRFTFVFFFYYTLVIFMIYCYDNLSMLFLCALTLLEEKRNCLIVETINGTAASDEFEAALRIALPFNCSVAMYLCRYGLPR